MGLVVTAGQATAPTDFASNVMEIAVPPGNPAGITALSDLTKPATKVALCQKAVPCGVTAAKVFTKAKLTVNPVSQELGVKATLTKAPNKGTAQAFTDYVLSADGASVLTAAGFARP
jgi:molybdate transport system substrate-binding protein